MPLHTLLRLFILFAVALVANDLQAQVTPSPAPPVGERQAAREKAVAIATKVPKDMGLLDLTQYVTIPVDRYDPADVLEDSDIKPFIPPIMMKTALIMVLFVPVKVNTGPTVAVYVDAQLGVVRGYLIGPRREQ
jgi:hypothetical protein